ncbi:hypothetical protein TrVE_jg10004 [Triparma verrucosa]|uniref:Uncharacterized protein n=2 Tax=Triparma TaxID=722752 RepID=A0A9W7BWM9_9STRA|nr:hypothetical protein TrST_g4072 [Triparma strigata]GMI15288.1 hypothetical protein TrVE_jg10004 [Triparma verrucosa]
MIVRFTPDDFADDGGGEQEGEGEDDNTGGEGGGDTGGQEAPAQEVAVAVQEARETVVQGTPQRRDDGERSGICPLGQPCDKNKLVGSTKVVVGSARFMVLMMWSALFAYFWTEF